MKAILLLLLGVISGTLAHVGWYEWRRPAAAGGDVIAWMEKELRLDTEQRVRIRALHASTAPQLRELARQAASLRAELDQFEAGRLRGERIDFLAFARFVEDWRRIEQLSAHTTRQLVAATADELTPEQRKLYLARLHLSPPRAS